MHSGGKTILLENGNYKAEIVSVGAGLASLTYKNKHLVIPHNPEVMPLAHMGKVMIPWPNRIAGGSYEFEGILYKVPINEHVTNAAIHGFLAWREWQVIEQSINSVTLKLGLPPSYGYPFLLFSTVTYSLNREEGLTIIVSTQNVGNKPAPYGVATHPYLTCNMESINHCSLLIPAKQVFTTDEKLNPVRLIPSEKINLDFTTEKQIENTFVDNTFLASSIPWKVELKSLQTGAFTYMVSDQPWIQIYSGDKLDRIGLAVEPMSCPPNAFNSKIGLVVLKPNEEHTLMLTIGGKI